MALNNPLIDDYSLKGAKGLLVNITGGTDLTLFEVDQAVNKIRAEVDPEAELIFGSIEDESLNGKIRVSIVATSLDGLPSESKTVLNMVGRIQNRNVGYSDSLFSKNSNIDNNTISSIEGATALKLDERFETDQNSEDLSETKKNSIELENNNNLNDSLIAGVSMESASYIENNTKSEVNSINEIVQNEIKKSSNEEHTPQLFSESDVNLDQLEEEKIEEDSSLVQTEDLFDKNNTDEDEFEIPAFLRKQKF
tara:strand:- start:12 stop:767 length:756 start_codon:yes stop_codon:yes gene_type:complete